MTDRIHVPWLPRAGGFKARLVEITVSTEYLDPIASLWLVGRGKEKSVDELKQMCARDLERTAGYRPNGDTWLWLGEGEDDAPLEVEAPPPDALFTYEGVVEGWLLGVHEDAGRFGEAASAIYQSLMAGEVRCVGRPPALEGTDFHPSTDLPASFFADVPRFDWTRARLIVPRGLPERHWASDRREEVASNIRFRRSDVWKLAAAFQDSVVNFGPLREADARGKRRLELAAKAFDEAAAASQPLPRLRLHEALNALLIRMKQRGLSAGEFEALWNERATREMKTGGRRRK